MQKLILQAPAKINLYLKVLSKRPDGFHNIETVFEKIDLCDEIALRRRKKQGIRISCRPQVVRQNSKNLAFQAAQALLAEVGSRQGVQISITKRIPEASGLGGGSSDAASVLLGLNRLLGLGASRRQLLKLAERLGADVPFFFSAGFRALGRGKGEVLTPIKAKRKNWYILVVPKALKVSTRRMYQDPRIVLTKHHVGVKIVLRALENGDLSALDKDSYNSFEWILQKKYKQISRIKKALKSSGACAALISGSGPCVFGIAQTRKEAMEIKDNLSGRKSWKVIVASSYSSS